MSIDAKIELVTYEPDGTATLHLGPRTNQDGPGQQQLTVVNPKPHMDALEGSCIWGNASEIMLGDRKLADRLSYVSIRLVDAEPERSGE